MLIGALVLAALAALTITLSSPLFAVLGFEYSALMALALSFVCGIVAARRGRQRILWTEIKTVVFQSIALAVVPLLISVFSLFIIPNCALWDGLLFYTEIALPSAILGGLFGLAFAWLMKRRGRAIIFFIGFWCVTLFLSFLPGYYNPQLYTYGWQYGFFPGITWDASIELTTAYFAFRLENIIWVMFGLSLGYEMRLPKKPKMWFVIPGIIALALFGFHDWFHITTSHDRLEAFLSATDRPVPNCTIYYAPNSLTNDELKKIERDVSWYLYAIEKRFTLSPNHPPIAIYIYPSSDKMFDLIGTRTASLAKPWLSEVHIAKENLESLKHELTHVLLREKGVFPFYASWSTGITEGAAMSVEPEYDGIYTLDEHAARILQMHYASGVKEIMSFSGFAANASEKSYVLAGSFSRYLLSQYGSGPFDRVYSSLDWRKEYGKPLDSLEAEWKRWLQPMMTSMDAGDSAHYNYYYNRTSIIYEPCLRRIGKLERKAGEAFAFHKFHDAENYYRSAIEEGAGISALFGVERSLLGEKDWHGAMDALDTTRTPSIQKQMAALDLPRADLHAIADDTAYANMLYTNATSIKLNWQRFIYAYASEILLQDDPSLWRNYLFNAFTNAAWNYTTSEQWLKTKGRMYPPDSNNFRPRFAVQIFRLDNILRNGFLHDANDSSFTISPIPSNLSTGDSLALSMYALRKAEIMGAPAARNFFPQQYERALEEMADELSAEWQFLQLNRAARGRGTNP